MICSISKMYKRVFLLAEMILAEVAEAETENFPIFTDYPTGSGF